MINKLIVLLIFFGLSSMSVLAFCVTSANSEIGGIDWIELETNKKINNHVDIVENEKQSFSEVDDHVEDSDLTEESKNQKTPSNSNSNKNNKKSNSVSSNSNNDYDELANEINEESDSDLGVKNNNVRGQSPIKENPIVENPITAEDDQYSELRDIVTSDNNPVEGPITATDPNSNSIPDEKMIVCYDDDDELVEEKAYGDNPVDDDVPAPLEIPEDEDIEPETDEEKVNENDEDDDSEDSPKVEKDEIKSEIKTKIDDEAKEFFSKNDKNIENKNQENNGLKNTNDVNNKSNDVVSSESNSEKNKSTSVSNTPDGLK